MTTETLPKGYMVNGNDRPFQEMADKNDPDFQRGGGNPDDGGRWRALITPDTIPNANIILGIYSLDPGETHLMHYHVTAAEFYYVLSGSGKFVMGEEEFRGEPGKLFYMPAEVNHLVHNDGDEPLTMVFGFDCGDLKDAKMVWVDPPK